ncbi:MAG: ArsB/NhaD family transporter [Caldilineales bacterium]|nr:ArsB/NhaD family transporter [Caldilineales bacterium]
MNEIVLAAIIFVITYIAIASERIDRTVAALIGGMAAILLIPSLDQENAFHAIDLNVIFLLAAMMIIANILSDTGVFQWLAVRAVLLGKGNPIRIMQILALVTALTSALLDNVTVVVLMAPVTLFVAGTLGLSPIPFLIAEVLASNIGGAATLIGDPPNILIGSAAGIDFTTFLLNMLPVVAVCLFVFHFMIPLLFRRDIPKDFETKDIQLETAGLIAEPVLLRQSLIILGLVIVGFLLHSKLHLETATVALAGAALLLWWTGRSSHEELRKVEWNTLFFFVGLFVLVEGLVVSGAIAKAAEALLEATGGDLTITTLSLLWVSAIASGIIDNIPYTATMIPLIENLGERGVDTWPLWWALAMGADFGGNFTLIGASANVVVASFAERSGAPISFGRFLRYGAAVMFMTLIFSTVYIYLRYLI